MIKRGINTRKLGIICFLLGLGFFFLPLAFPKEAPHYSVITPDPWFDAEMGEECRNLTENFVTNNKYRVVGTPEVANAAEWIKTFYEISGIPL